MVVVSNLFLLLIGFALLVFSGDKLVENSIKLATRWSIPAAVIAVTIIAAGTSAPELVTSFMAAFNETTDISVGNVIGSNIFNILAVGGLSMVIYPNYQSQGALFSWPVLLVASCLFTYFLMDYQLTRIEGVILFLGLIFFIVLSFQQGASDEPATEVKVSGSQIKELLGVALGLVGLLLGAELALQGGIGLGRMAGLSERVIGITIISVGTGLPELATSVAAALRKQYDVAIANILGSNIFNTLGIPGVTAVVFPMSINKELLNYDSYIMMAATVSVVFFFFIKQQKIRRVIGVGFIIGYITYVSSIVVSGL